MDDQAVVPAVKPTPVDEVGAYVVLAREVGAQEAFDAWLGDHADADHQTRWSVINTLVGVQFWRHITADDQAAILRRYRPDADLSSGEAAMAEWRWGACLHAGTGESSPELLWAVRPLHHHIWTSAKSRLVGPWATFAATMARVVATVPPFVKIQPDRSLGGTGIGSWASLNLFTALVGPPGAGKNAGLAVSAELIEFDDKIKADVEPLGSGEGIAHMFMMRPRPSRDDPEPRPVMYRTNVLVTVGEVDAFAAVAGRRGSTLGAQVRAAANGEMLGFFYVDPTKRMPVADHSYRLCLIAGVQPKRSGVLLTGPEANGGTPQRFIWLPATDPLFSRGAIPDTPPPVRWHPPAWPQGRTGVTVCDSAREAVLVQREQVHDGTLSEDDAHATLLRIKVAAALAIMDGRTAVAEDDWGLSRIIMDASAGTRDHCRRILAQVAAEENVHAGRAEAVRVGVVEDASEERAITRACNAIVRKLMRAGGPVTGGDIRRACSEKSRPYFEDAIERLVGLEAIVAIQPDDGRAGMSYVLTEHTKG